MDNNKQINKLINKEKGNMWNKVNTNNIIMIMLIK